MAYGDPYYGCLPKPSIEEMVTTLLVKVAGQPAGTRLAGLRVEIITGSPTIVEPYVDCTKPGIANMQQALQDSIREAENGDPALFLYNLT